MTYAVNDSCIKCKFTDCVDVCPVDCFYEGENMLVIHPDSDIAEKWIKLNAEYAVIWPNISRKKAAPLDADEWRGKADKMQFFSPNPGKK